MATTLRASPFRQLSRTALTKRTFTCISSRSSLLSLSSRSSPLVNSQLVRPSFAFPRRHLTTEQRAEIQKAVDTHPVVLFMKGTPDSPQCGFSRAVIQILDLQQVPTEKFKTYNVLDSLELREGVKEFSEWPTIPQLYVNGDFVGGCDIILSMHQSGELEKVLETQGIIPKIEAAAPQ